MPRLGLAAFAVLQLVACQDPIVPFPGSPAGCSCSSLPLEGSYSAGALALCTGCTDVHRSTDQDSCPEGWKIFSPASKGDWDTALASVRAIQAQHDLLVDVTRGASVCEDCPPGRFSQSSFAAEAEGTGWVTSDFTDWWLRDADAPSQPSGDYTANCYLGVGEITDTSNIIFNGGACNHHSTEYLCQPAVPPCGCQVLVNQAQPDDVKFCSKDRSSQGQADQCYPRQADGTRDGTCPGDMTKCNGLFRAPISGCGDFELRNGAKESQEFLCYQKHPESQDAQQNGNYLVPTQGCSTKYCTRCSLSKCQNSLDQTDTDCATKELWKCCMRKSVCASDCASSQEECFDCLHDDSRRTAKCCEEVGLPGSLCQASDRLPLCDLSSCEAGDEDCKKTQRMRCCVKDAWDCQACETPGCVQSCRESRREECCADVGIESEAECAAVRLVDVPCFQPGDVVMIASLGLCDTVEEETCADDEISLGPGGIGFIPFEDLELVDNVEECPCFHRGDWVLIHSLDVCGTVEETICAEQSGFVNAYQPDSYDPYMLIEDPVSFDNLWPCPADVPVPCFEEGDWVNIRDTSECGVLQGKLCAGDDEQQSVALDGGFALDHSFWDLKPCTCVQPGDWVYITPLSGCGNVGEREICEGQGSGPVYAYVQAGSYELTDAEFEFSELGPCPDGIPVPCFQAGEWVSVRSTGVCFQLQGDLCAGGAEVSPGDLLPDVGFWDVEPCTCFQTGDVVLIDSISLCNTVKEEICAGESGLVGWGSYPYGELELMEDSGACPCYPAKDRVGIEDTGLCGTLRWELCTGQQRFVDADDGSATRYWYSQLGPCQNEPPCLEELAWVRVRGDGRCGTLQEELCASEEIAQSVILGVGDVATFFYRDLEPCPDPIPCFQAKERVSISGQCGILQEELCADSAVQKSVDLIDGPTVTVQAGFWDLEPCTCLHSGDWVLVDSISLCNTVKEKICAGESGLVGWGSYPYEELELMEDGAPCPCYPAKDRVGIRDTGLCGTLRWELCVNQKKWVDKDDGSANQYWYAQLGPCQNEPPCLEELAWVRVRGGDSCGTLQEELCASEEIAKPVVVDGVVAGTFFYRDLAPCPDPIPCFEAEERVSVSGQCGILQEELCADSAVPKSVDLLDGPTVQAGFWDLEPCPCFNQGDVVFVNQEFCDTVEQQICPGDVAIFFMPGASSFASFDDLQLIETMGDCPRDMSCIPQRSWVRTSSNSCGVLLGESCPEDTDQQVIKRPGGGFFPLTFKWWFNLEYCRDPIPCLQVGDRVSIQDMDSCGTVQSAICADDEEDEVDVLVDAGGDHAPGPFELPVGILAKPCWSD